MGSPLSRLPPLSPRRVSASSPKPDDARCRPPRYLQVVLRAALLVVVVLAVAGCGGDSEPSASENYANEVCSSFSTWLTDVAEHGADGHRRRPRDDEGRPPVGRGRRRERHRQARTRTWRRPGAPDTEDGQKAKSEVESLMSQIRDQLATIQSALDSNAGILSIASTVSASVSTALNDLETTYNNLKDLDPAGELRDAFENSDDCNSLQNRSRQHPLLGKADRSSPVDDVRPGRRSRVEAPTREVSLCPAARERSPHLRRGSRSQVRRPSPPTSSSSSESRATWRR